MKKKRKGSSNGKNEFSEMISDELYNSAGSFNPICLSKVDD